MSGMASWSSSLPGMGRSGSVKSSIRAMRSWWFKCLKVPDGLSMPGTRMRFLGEPLTLAVSEQMLRRVMNGTEARAARSATLEDTPSRM